MSYSIGTVTGGLGDEAHYKALAAIRTLLLAAGWTELRYDVSGADKELIMNSTGLFGTEDIYIGFKTYQSVGADYYNMAAACFTGFITGNSFETQPGARLSGTPCHNNAVTYFMTANEQRIVGCFKVGTPTYTHFYAGKMFPYARPGEFPAPLVVAGSFNGKELRRYSDTDYQFPYYGFYQHSASGNGAPSQASRLYLRTQSGVWQQQYHNPFRNGLNTLRPPGVNYQLLPIVMFGNTTWQGARNLWGELDGVRAITGFNNGVENVLQQGGTPVDQTGMTVLEAVDAVIAAGGRAYVILQDGSRNGFNNFVAVEMS